MSLAECDCGSIITDENGKTIHFEDCWLIEREKGWR